MTTDTMVARGTSSASTPRSAMELEWCGASSGGTVLSGPAAGSWPATDRIAARVSASSGVNRGSNPMNRWPAWSCRYPAARPAAGGARRPRRSRRPAGVLLTDHIGQVGRRRTAPIGHRARSGQPAVAAQEPHHVRQVRGAVDRDALDQRGLVEHRRRHHRAPQPRPARGQQARQHTAHRAQPAVEGELAQQHRPVQGVLVEDPVRGEHGPASARSKPR